MNLSSRVSKLEAATDTGRPIIIWADAKAGELKPPEQIAAEIAEHGGSNGRRVLLIGWKTLTPEVMATLPKGTVSIGTGVLRSNPGIC